MTYVPVRNIHFVTQTEMALRGAIRFVKVAGTYEPVHAVLELFFAKLEYFKSQKDSHYTFLVFNSWSP
jgi:hypothetical protein